MCVENVENVDKKDEELCKVIKGNKNKPLEK